MLRSDSRLAATHFGAVLDVHVLGNVAKVDQAKVERRARVVVVVGAAPWPVWAIDPSIASTSIAFQGPTVHGINMVLLNTFGSVTSCATAMVQLDPIPTGQLQRQAIAPMSLDA